MSNQQNNELASEEETSSPQKKPRQQDSCYRSISISQSASTSNDSCAPQQSSSSMSMNPVEFAQFLAKIDPPSSRIPHNPRKGQISDIPALIRQMEQVRRGEIPVPTVSSTPVPSYAQRKKARQEIIIQQRSSNQITYSNQSTAPASPKTIDSDDDEIVDVQ
jgi:hypothetical protein